MTRGRPGDVQADESTGRAEVQQVRPEGSHAGAGGYWERLTATNRELQPPQKGK